MIDMSLKKSVGITSWMAFNIRARFGLYLADNASNASYGSPGEETILGIVSGKQCCSAHRLTNGPLW